ncbi:hypothetical protein ACFV42_23605 [Streptomyces solisilvae]|uniref:hypothetical protein n=1 Tax=Streptomyces malaysiensis TaxID=92644 RepID=UPI0036912819
MDLNRSPYAIAGAAAEEVRALNHRTFDGAGYNRPSQVGDVAGALSALASQLPQALRQAAGGFEALVDTGRVQMYDAQGETVAERAGQVYAQLDAAAAAADALSEALKMVQNLTADIGLRDSA